MYLVYEKNYLNYGDVDCVEEEDMKLFSNKGSAIKERERIKLIYIEDTENGFTYMEDESTDTCIVFADDLIISNNDRSGEFHICLVELNVSD